MCCPQHVIRERMSRGCFRTHLLEAVVENFVLEEGFKNVLYTDFARMMIVFK
jgi:hypothetical protein